MQRSDQHRNATDRHLVLIRRKLFTAKLFYEHALEHGLKNGPLDKMIAVHNMHNAIEFVLKAIITSFSVDVHRRAGFPQLIDRISKAGIENDGVKIRLPYQREIMALNDLRNMVQHDAHEPSNAIMREHKSTTGAFLDETVQLYFNIDFQELSSTDLISDDIIRELLQLAEQNCRHFDAVEESDTNDESDWTIWLESLALLESVFVIALRNVLEEALVPSTIGHLMRIPKTLSEVPKPTRRNASHSLDNRTHLLWQRIRNIEIYNLCQLLSIQYWRLEELCEHAPDIATDKDDRIWIFPATDSSMNPTFIRRMIAFLVPLICDWEARGWLSNPGINHTDPYSSLSRKLLNAESVVTLDSADDIDLLKDLEAVASLASTLYEGFDGRAITGDITLE